MEIHFEKWHGTGNDFILVDDREGRFPGDAQALVGRLCDRHFGIGSDGLILLRAPEEAGTDFHMEFFNPDGSRSFCGNGSRCAFAFWSALNGRVERARFTAIDGVHEGCWMGPEVAVTLPDVAAVESGVDGAQVDRVNTGSPHELVWCDDVEAVEILADAPQRRHAPRHGPGGSNINYVQPVMGGLRMRTYERGVENETLSCGSGVVAAALSALHREVVEAPVDVEARGGRLSVEARRLPGVGFTGIRLIGPVEKIFQGVFIA